MIGKFGTKDIPAVGFSIGFERIFQILCQNNFEIPKSEKKIATINDDNFIEAEFKALEFQKEYATALFKRTKKVDQLIKQLNNSNFTSYYLIGKSKRLKFF